MPWCTMFLVWLTVTLRVLKSGYMNASGLVGCWLIRSAFAAAMGLLLALSTPRTHGTVRAELVRPTPVIWSYPPDEEARACPGGPTAISAPSASTAVDAPTERARDSRAEPRAARRPPAPTGSPRIIAASWRCSLSARGIPRPSQQMAGSLPPAPARLRDDRRHESESEQQGSSERHQCDLHFVAKADRR